MRLYSIGLFLSNLFHLTQCPSSPSSLRHYCSTVSCLFSYNTTLTFISSLPLLFLLSDPKLLAEVIISSLALWLAHDIASTTSYQLSHMVIIWNIRFFFFFHFGHIHTISKFLGQGSNLCHSTNPSHCSDLSRSLTCCATRELQDVFYNIFIYVYFTSSQES